MPAHYFIGSQLLASGPESLLGGGSHSQAYFCQTCGEIWARIVADSSPDHWDIDWAPCVKHIGTSALCLSRVPGTLAQGSTDQISTMRHVAAVEWLPLPVLEREFHLMYEHLFKELS